MEELTFGVHRDGEVDDKRFLLYVELYVRDPSEGSVTWYPVNMLFDTGAMRTLLPHPKQKEAGKPQIPMKWMSKGKEVKICHSTHMRISKYKDIRFTFRDCDMEFPAKVSFMPHPDEIHPDVQKYQSYSSLRKLSQGRAVESKPHVYGLLCLSDVLRHFDLQFDTSDPLNVYVAKFRYRAGGMSRGEQSIEEG